MFKCFGKVRNSRRMESDKVLENLYSEKKKATSEEDMEEIEVKIAENL